MNFYPLYKRVRDGSIHEWNIEAIDTGYQITQGNPEASLKTRKTTCKPQNVGTENEITARERGEMLAYTRFEKQLENGYTSALALDEASEKPSGVSGEVSGEVGAKGLRETLMLPSDYTEGPHDVNFLDANGVYIQPIFCGVRCMAYLEDNKVVLQGENGETRYEVPPHIETALTLVLSQNTGMVFEGTLTLNDVGPDEIVESVLIETEHTAHLEFIITDILYTEKPFSERFHILNELYYLYDCGEAVRAVSPALISNQKTLEAYHTSYVRRGFDGTRIFQGSGYYRTTTESNTVFDWKVKEGKYKIIGHKEDHNGELVWVVDLGGWKRGVDHIPHRCSWLRSQALIPVAHKYHGQYLKIKYHSILNSGHFLYGVGVGFARA